MRNLVSLIAVIFLNVSRTRIPITGLKLKKRKMVAATISVYLRKMSRGAPKSTGLYAVDNSQYP